MAQKIQKLIHLLNRQTIEEDLLRMARERLGEDAPLEREVGHLVAVLTNPVLLVTSLYDLLRAAHFGSGDPLPIASLRFWKSLPQQEPEVIHGVLQAPDTMKALGDKCLFDHAVVGRRAVQGVDLEILGTQAYERASQILQILADDRRLRSFYEANRFHRVSLPEEIAFLHGCAEKFPIYDEILKSLVRASTRVPDEGEDRPARPGKSDPPPVPQSRANSLPHPRIDLGRTEDGAAGPDPLHPDPGPPAEPVSDGDTSRILAGLERWVLFSSLDVERLREYLERVIVNQSEAVDRLCDDLVLFGTGTADPRRPSSYFLLGPTGVGKNYLVEQMVEGFRLLWGVDVPYVLIEGPQYTYPSDINELKGAARGFIRSDEEGILTEFHKRSGQSPLAIVLVDEVEKAHPQLRRFFLSVMDRGTITDNRGDVLDFSNTMFFYTSNVGYSDSARRTRPIGYGDDATGERREWQSIVREVRRQLSPEFMNRVSMLHFNYLHRKDASRIFDLEFAKIAARYKDRQGIEVRCTNRARSRIIELGFDSRYGARNLASVLNRLVNIGLSRRLRRDDPPDGREVGGVLEIIRRVRGGEATLDIRDLEALARDAARSRVGYGTVLVDFRRDEFRFDPR